MRHPNWPVWHGMKQRCTNNNRTDYKYYGGAGITFEPPWETLEGFNTDMGVRPSLLHTLDRKDNNKGYSKDNCRWATRKQQALNTAHCTVVDGKSLSDWAKELRLSLSCVCRRYTKYGEMALVPSFVPNGLVHGGEVLTLPDWARRLGISTPALRQRITRWGIDQALSTLKYETRRNNTNAKRIK